MRHLFDGFGLARLVTWSGALAALFWLLPILSDLSNDADILFLCALCLTLTLVLGVILWRKRGLRAAVAPTLRGLALGIVGTVVSLFVGGQYRFILWHANKMTMASRMKQIGEALIKYDEKQGHLPPAAIKDEMGHELLSWRVAILPYLGEEQLYGEFHLGEPWDSEHNRGLLWRMPKPYATPGRGLGSSHDTIVQVLTGNGTLFDPGKRCSLANVFELDALDDTLLLVEAAAAVPWTKPADVPFDAKGTPRLGGLGNIYYRGLLISAHRQPHTTDFVFADLSVRGVALPEVDASAEKLAKWQRMMRTLAVWHGKGQAFDVNQIYWWDD